MLGLIREEFNRFNLEIFHFESSLNLRSAEFEKNLKIKHSLISFRYKGDTKTSKVGIRKSKRLDPCERSFMI